MYILKFSTGNAKLGKRLIFSLPAGYTCPNAGYCKTFADRQTGKVMDLPMSSNATGNEYRCFAAMSEARSKQCRDARWPELCRYQVTSGPSFTSRPGLKLPKLTQT